MSEQNVEGQQGAPVVLSVAGAATALGYDAPRVYRASGRVTFGGVSLVLGVGVVMSVLSAVVAWGWYYFRLPSFLVLPMIAQGAVLGGILGWLCQRARLRNVPLAVGIGILCGTCAAASYQAVLYVRSVQHFPSDLGRMLEDRYGMVRGSPESERALAKVREARFAAYDQFVLIPLTGRGGYRGYLSATTLGHRIFAIGQALVVAVLAGWIAKHYAGKPYCETCQRWYGDPREVAEVPLAMVGALEEVVRADSPEMALAVRGAWQGDVRGSWAAVQIYRCRVCGEQLAAACRRTVESNNHVKTKRVMPLHRVSGETAAALKGEVIEENREEASEVGESVVTQVEDPHPNPPPEYRERGSEESA